MFVHMVYFVEFGIKPFEYSHFIGWGKIFSYFKYTPFEVQMMFAKGIVRVETNQNYNY